MKQKKALSMSEFFLLTLTILLLAALLYIEASPYKIVSSSVFSSADQTEIRLYVIANTLMPIQEDELARQVVENHLKQNGPRGKTTYELRVYRTEVHYHFHIESGVIFCSESGLLL